MNKIKKFTLSQKREQKDFVGELIENHFKDNGFEIIQTAGANIIAYKKYGERVIQITQIVERRTNGPLIRTFYFKEEDYAWVNFVFETLVEHYYECETIK